MIYVLQPWQSWFLKLNIVIYLTLAIIVSFYTDSASSKLLSNISPSTENSTLNPNTIKKLSVEKAAPTGIVSQLPNPISPRTPELPKPTSPKPRPQVPEFELPDTKPPSPEEQKIPQQTKF